MPGVPYTYQMLARVGFERMDLPALRTLTQAGGKLGVESISRFHAHMASRGGRFFVMYGQTEAAPRIACLPWDRLEEKLGSAGIALPGGRLCVDPGDGSEAGPGVAGEILYFGPNVMMGYATSRGELSRGDDLKGVLATGDLGHLDAEGFLFITGRSKRIGKVFGLRVNLDEVEASLRVHGPTAVVAGDDRLVIHCEWGDLASFAAVARQLATEMRVNHSAFAFRRVDSLPLTASGKVDYPLLSAN
jgi:acyl-CoA synthetase (AMP-forming)/AMP-acid ligase II